MSGGDLKLSFSARSKSTNSFATYVPSSLEEYEVAELTWEKGQVATYGLGPPRKPPAADTLESIVDQATAAALPHSKSKQLVPWLDTGPAVSAAVDALVPCNNSIAISDNRESSTTQVPTCMVASCSGGGCWPHSHSGTERDDSQPVTLDSCAGGGGLTSTSLWSPENTSSADDHDVIVSRTRLQRHAGGERGKRNLGVGKSSVIVAAIHNQSERRRRDKINERMKTLQKLVPNSSKTDKASMLDEVIEYLKQLQAQIQMMSSLRWMMMPLPMQVQQQLQMSMMANMNMNMNMGMGVMDINAICSATGIPPMMPTPATTFTPMPSWGIQSPQLAPDLLSNFFPHQSQPMTMDGYSRLAALYHQFQQSSSAGSGPKN